MMHRVMLTVTVFWLMAGTAAAAFWLGYVIGNETMYCVAFGRSEFNRSTLQWTLRC